MALTLIVDNNPTPEMTELERYTYATARLQELWEIGNLDKLDGYCFGLFAMTGDAEELTDIIFLRDIIAELEMGELKAELAELS